MHDDLAELLIAPNAPMAGFPEYGLRDAHIRLLNGGLIPEGPGLPLHLSTLIRELSPRAGVPCAG